MSAPQPESSDVIYALASGSTPAAIAVMRISGSGTDAVLSGLIAGPLPPTRRASVRRLVDPRNGEALDDALVLRFSAGASYTGEDSAELQLHGGEMVVSAVEGALIALGARMATPGEFSRRALAEGRLDLAQAEAVAALIHAESESARRQALRVLDGALGEQVAAWRTRMIEAAAYLETGVDFVDEDLGDELILDAAQRLASLRQDLSQHLESARNFDAQDEALSIVFVGPPNAGKSSLLNAITGRDLAIVTEIAGTTRDVLRTSLKVAGVTLELADTAGQRESDDRVEAEGVARARAAADKAWRRIHVISADTEDAARRLLDQTPPRPGDAVFWTKSDRDDVAPEDIASAFGPRFYAVSARDSTARAAFLSYLEQERPQQTARPSAVAGSQRRAGLVAKAVRSLERAEAQVRSGSIELGAAELRDAMHAVESLIGVVDHEQILDLVFSSFCIGK